MTPEADKALRAVNLYLRDNPKASIAAAARALGYRKGQVYRWRKIARDRGGAPIQDRRGAPTMENDEIRERLLKAVSLGLKEDSCAHYAFISPKTLRHWLVSGADGKGEHGPFALRFRAAQAEMEASRLERMDRATEGTEDDGPRPNWLPDAWWLERASAGRYTVDRANRDHEAGPAGEDPAINMAALEAKLLRMDPAELAVLPDLPEEEEG